MTHTQPSPKATGDSRRERAGLTQSRDPVGGVTYAVGAGGLTFGKRGGLDPATGEAPCAYGFTTQTGAEG
jgi:hypothetical protein